MEAIVLAGGLGTRLGKILIDTPKPMALIGSKPFLAVLLDYLITQGITDVILSVGYLHDKIEQYFGSSYGPLRVKYSLEHSPLGTGGAIRKAQKLSASGHSFVLNGDSFLALNYSQMKMAHMAASTRVSIALRPVHDTSRYGKVTVESGTITVFAEKSSTGCGLINAGVYMLSTSTFDGFQLPEVFSFEKDFLLPFVAKLKPIPFFTDAYFIDIGVPEDLQRAQKELVEMP